MIHVSSQSAKRVTLVEPYVYVVELVATPLTESPVASNEHRYAISKSTGFEEDADGPERYQYPTSLNVPDDPQFHRITYVCQLPVP